MQLLGMFLGLLELLGDTVLTSKQRGSAVVKFHKMVSQYLLLISSPNEGGVPSLEEGSDGVTVPGGEGQ